VSLVFIIWLSSAWICLGQSQPPSTAAAPSSSVAVTSSVVQTQDPSMLTGRLEQLEATYRDALQKRHKKIIDQYFLELKNAQALATTAADRTAFQAEITRLTNLRTLGTGILEPAATPQPTAPVSTIAAVPGRVFSLEPHETLVPQTPGVSTLMLGDHSWKLSKLSEGTYQIVAEYSCAAVPKDAAVEVTFAGQTIQNRVGEDMSTRDDKTFLFLRLGRLTVTEEKLNELIRVQAKGGTAPWLNVKRIVLSRLGKKGKENP
jgi:hypothetical protein